MILESDRGPCLQESCCKSQTQFSTSVWANFSTGTGFRQRKFSCKGFKRLLTSQLFKACIELIVQRFDNKPLRNCFSNLRSAASSYIESGSVSHPTPFPYSCHWFAIIPVSHRNIYVVLVVVRPCAKLLCHKHHLSSAAANFSISDIWAHLWYVPSLDNCCSLTHGKKTSVLHQSVSYRFPRSLQVVSHRTVSNLGWTSEPSPSYQGCW